jgi:hypothetical protein
MMNYSLSKSKEKELLYLSAPRNIKGPANVGNLHLNGGLKG